MPDRPVSNQYSEPIRQVRAQDVQAGDTLIFHVADYVNAQRTVKSVLTLDGCTRLILLLPYSEETFILDKPAEVLLYVLDKEEGNGD